MKTVLTFQGKIFSIFGSNNSVDILLATCHFYLKNVTSKEKGIENSNSIISLKQIKTEFVQLKSNSARYIILSMVKLILQTHFFVGKLKFNYLRRFLRKTKATTATTTITPITTTATIKAVGRTEDDVEDVGDADEGKFNCWVEV